MKPLSDVERKNLKVCMAVLWVDASAVTVNSRLFFDKFCKWRSDKKIDADAKALLDGVLDQFDKARTVWALSMGVVRNGPDDCLSADEARVLIADARRFVGDEILIVCGCEFGKGGCQNENTDKSH